MDRPMARMLLCLSSSHETRFRRRLVGLEYPEEATGDVAFQTPLDLARRPTLGCSPRHVLLRFGMESHPRKHDRVERSVELTITGTV